MPKIRSADDSTGREVLIVGNGPSCALAPWPGVLQRLGKKDNGSGKRVLPDLVLINRAALGKTCPTFAVTVNAETLSEYQRRDLHTRARIISNATYKVVPKGRLEELRKILEAPNFLEAPDDWPAHASGPLALWAMTALGYSTVYIFGMDGTCHESTEEVIVRRARIWETWMTRYQIARPKGQRTRVVRVWPAGIGWRPDEKDDPLAPALSATLEVPRQRERSR
jgi:hypothetical protein